MCWGPKQSIVATLWVCGRLINRVYSLTPRLWNKINREDKKNERPYNVAEPACSGVNVSNKTDVGGLFITLGWGKVAIHQNQTEVHPRSLETCGWILEASPSAWRQSHWAVDNLGLFSTLGLSGFFVHRQPFLKNVEIWKTLNDWNPVPSG